MKEIELSTSLYWMISLTLTQCQINWFEGYRIKYFSLPNDIFDINKCQILKSKVPSRGHYMVSVTHTWAPSPQRERERGPNVAEKDIGEGLWIWSPTYTNDILHQPAFNC